MHRKPKSKRHARSREARFVPGAAESVSGAPARAVGRFRGWRGWLLRVVLMVLAPALVVAMLEGGLRLAGYGYPTGFLVGPDAKGGFATNHRFGWRFYTERLKQRVDERRGSGSAQHCQ